MMRLPKSRVTQILAAAVLITGLCATSVVAAGFATSGVGIKARAMGGAFRGIADDWSAASYNPAGLAFLEGNELNATLGIYNPRLIYTPNIQPNGVDIGFEPANGLEVPPIDDIWPMPSLAGILVPEAMEGTAFGLAVYWPHDVNFGWDIFYQPVSYNSEPGNFPIEDYRTDLDVLDIHPVIAHRFGETFALGGGLSLTNGDLVYRRVLYVENTLGAPFDVYPYDNFLGDLDIEGNGFAVGGNVGMLWKPSESFSFGFSVQTPVTVPLSGHADLNMKWPINLKLAQEQIFLDVDEDNENDFDRTVFAGNTDISLSAEHHSSAPWEVDLELPGQIGAGIAWRAGERFTLAFDLALTFWSSVDEWRISFGGDGLLSNVDSLGPITELVVPFNWENQIRLSGGGEYYARGNLALRGGLYWEAGAAVDETFTIHFPDVGDRVGLTGGFAYTINDKWEAAMAQEILFFSERTVDVDTETAGVSQFPGDYSLTRWETLLSLAYRF